MDKDIKNYIHDHNRQAVDSSIQTVTNHVQKISEDMSDLKVAVENIRVTGENTLRQTLKTNGRVTNNEDAIEKNKDKDAEVRLGFEKRITKAEANASMTMKFKLAVLFLIGIVPVLYIVSMFTGVPINNLINLL